MSIMYFDSVPNLKTVRELIYKRGYGKVNHQRIPLTDNALIEKYLGKISFVLAHFLYLFSSWKETAFQV